MEMKIVIETWNDKWRFEITDKAADGIVKTGERETFTACAADCLEFVAENAPVKKMEIEMTTAEEIKGQFEENVDKYDGFTELGAGMAGATIGILEKSCGNKENRKLVMKELTGRTSSKDLHPAQWDALYKLVQPWKPENGKWGSGNPDLERICNILLNKAVDQPGQGKFDFPEFKALDEDKLWIDQIGATDSLEDTPF